MRSTRAPEHSASASSLIGTLFGQAAPRASGVLGWCMAISAHALVAGLALAAHSPRAPETPPVVVELTRPEPVTPSPPTLPVPPVEPATHASTPRVAAARSEPARAAALHTAKAEPLAPAQDDLVDFTNDASVVGFGAGVVAVGGQAKLGLPDARPGGASSSNRGEAARGNGLTPASDLSQRPALNESDPCRGYFPASASDDSASAVVMVTIARTGAVASVKLLSESAQGQGFGAAARACMASKQFRPGLDRAGAPTATAIRVTVRFTR
jgi:TonB family protein